jgi:hypothetical protein
VIAAEVRVGVANENAAQQGVLHLLRIFSGFFKRADTSTDRQGDGFAGQAQEKPA